MKHSFPALVLSEPDALQAEVDALKHLPAETAAELDDAILTAYGSNAKKIGSPDSLNPPQSNSIQPMS